MKTKNILALLCASCASLFLASSCMDGDWDSPQLTAPPYGNNAIDSTKIVTIAELKKLYPGHAAETPILMDSAVQLKVYVTGNDIQGNLYNSIAVQDQNGDAMLIAIGESSLYGYLPVGQELLIDLKGLYIGGYGSQPQIGVPYTNASGRTYVSRMPGTLWQQHVKILSTKHTAEPIEFIPSMDITTHCGKLMTIKNVSVKGADGTLVWANKASARSNAVELQFDGLNSNYLIYTSIYADFANAIVPQGKMNLTGIWKRFNNKWELILRSEDDIEVIK